MQCLANSNLPSGVLGNTGLMGVPSVVDSYAQMPIFSVGTFEKSGIYQLSNSSRVSVGSSSRCSLYSSSVKCSLGSNGLNPLPSFGSTGCRQSRGTCLVSLSEKARCLTSLSELFSAIEILYSKM